MTQLDHNADILPGEIEPVERRRFARYAEAKLPTMMSKAVMVAFVIEVVSHYLGNFTDQPVSTNLLRLVGVMTLISPTFLVVFISEKRRVRVGLILAGLCLMLTVILDLTKDIHSIEDWMVIGNHSAIRGELRWATLVGGIFLLFLTLFEAIAELIVSRSHLRVERRELLEEMRQRKVAEQKAQAARDLAENLIHTANAIVIGLDRDRKLTVYNAAAARITGYSREELNARGWFNTIMPPERYPDARERLLRLLAAGLPQQLESTILTKSGEERQIAWSISEIVENGQVAGTISFGLDITDRKRAEAGVLRSSKLAALGVVAAGLAHEIGNPLASLSARLRVMEENDDPAFWRESIEVLQRHITRISRIVYGVSRFSRPPRTEPTMCSVNTLVGNALDVVRFHERAKHGEIGMELANILPDVKAVPDQLVQVFLNIALNALEAMPDGGTLTVTTGMAGDMVEVSFRDTGTGLTEEAKKRMFQDFYTSKAEGMGLGLNIAKSIIEGHRGRIECENNEAGGACFRVLLPVTDPPPPASGDPNGGMT